MESIIRLFIYIHAALGTIGFITGIIVLFIQKGTAMHKKLGKIFFVSMLTSCSISLVISKLPGHKSQFLFLIGLFTIYMLITGRRALTFKPKIKQKANGWDYLITGSMLVIALIMIVMGGIAVLQQVSGGVLYLFFGTFALFFSIQDLKMYRTFLNRKNAWLLAHIGKMTGAFVASVTAFLVGGMKMQGLVYWIVPSVIGLIYIYYYTRKFKQKTPVKIAEPV